MTALTHQLTSRTMVAAAFLAAAVLAVIAALLLGITATSGHPASGHSRPPASGSQPVPDPASGRPDASSATAEQPSPRTNRASA